MDKTAGFDPYGDSQLSYLGDLEESLGDVNNTFHLLHVLDAGLDSGGVVGPGLVEDVEDLLVLAIGPLRVHGATVLDEATPDSEKAEGNDGLLVHNVVLIADGVDRETGSAGKNGGLGEKAVSGERIDNGLGLLLGVLGGNVGGVAGRRERGEGGNSSPSDGRPDEVGACRKRSETVTETGGGRQLIISINKNAFSNVPTALRAKRDAIVLEWRC